jgi:predicted hydrocarbon binding protein
MNVIPKSGYMLPNRFGRITLETVEELLTPKGMESLLTLANMPDRIGNYPPANLERGFDFAEMGAINLGLEELYGPRGGRGLALRSGRTIFANALSHFGAMAGVEAAAYRILPRNFKLKAGLSSLARIFSDFSDQQSNIEEKSHDFHFLVHRNSTCWGRSNEDRPVCFMMVGVLQETLNRLSNGEEFRVDESECLASEGKVCRFVIQKEPIG